MSITKQRFRATEPSCFATPAPVCNQTARSLGSWHTRRKSLIIFTSLKHKLQEMSFINAPAPYFRLLNDTWLDRRIHFETHQAFYDLTPTYREETPHADRRSGSKKISRPAFTERTIPFSGPFEASPSEFRLGNPSGLYAFTLGLQAGQIEPRDFSHGTPIARRADTRLPLRSLSATPAQRTRTGTSTQASRALDTRLPAELQPVHFFSPCVLDAPHIYTWQLHLRP